MQMINTKSNLKHRLMAIRFAIWDLHLYLDTHPGDCAATELIEKYKKQYEKVLPEYICRFGPLTAEDCSEKWLCSPFPWVNTGSDC